MEISGGLQIELLEHLRQPADRVACTKADDDRTGTSQRQAYQQVSQPPGRVGRQLGSDSNHGDSSEQAECRPPPAGQPLPSAHSSILSNRSPEAPQRSVGTLPIPTCAGVRSRSPAVRGHCGWPRCRSAPASGMMGMVRPTVLIVDDHAAFRDAARSLLETEGFEIVGEAAGGHDALAAADSLRPDVVLLDIQLPDLDGFAVADELASHRGAPDVVLISSRDAETYGDRLAHAPARGFLAKRDLSGAALARLLA